MFFWVINAVNNIISNNKLSHAYIIELNNYDDDYKLVFDFIKLILCNNKENKFDNLNCGSCNICYLIDNGNYPDIKIVETDTNAIRKEQIIQLQDDFKNKSLLDNKRVYVIKEAEKLNLASSNTLLKFIEEPEPDIIAILLTKNRYKLLDTIISRCQILKIDDTNFSDIKLDDYDIRFFECIFNKSLFTNYNFILNNIFIDKNSTFIRFNNFITYFIKYLKEDSCFDDLESNLYNILNNYNLNQISVLINIFETEIKKLDYNVNLKLWLDNLYSRILLEV